MQEYDESFFRAKANKRARLTWLILLAIITVYYGVKIPSGDVELSRFLAFTITGWLLYISGAVYLIIRGIIELVYIVLQSVVKPGITGFFKIDLHIKCYIYLS